MRPSAILFLLTAVLVCAALQFAGGADRPNILLMVADDQGYGDLGCAGFADDVKTPHLDALAKQGVRFTQAYASSPICNASRAALMTGCYQQRQGIWWYGGPGIHDTNYPTLPELLRREGYLTGYVGKFHYGKADTHQPGRRSFPLNHGFDEFYGFSGGRKHYLKHRAEDEAAFQKVKEAHQRQGQSLQQGPMWSGTEQVDQEGFSTELFGTRAREFLRRNQDRPFFLQLAFNAVHNFTHQLPAEYLREHRLEGYRDWDPAREDYYDWYRQGRKPNNPEGRAHYLGQLHYLDLEVGRMMAALKELKLLTNTLVIYIGDNGGSTPIYAHNGPLRGSKYTLYEGGIRVPCIVSWPARYQTGQVRSNVVSALDVLPTVCAAAGVSVPDLLDGLDLNPLLTGQDRYLEHETLVWDTGHETALRQGRWKLRIARSKKHADYEMVDLEVGTFLYNLEADPGEAINMAGTLPNVVDGLRRLHSTWKATLKTTPTDPD